MKGGSLYDECKNEFRSTDDFGNLVVGSVLWLSER